VLAGTRRIHQRRARHRNLGRRGPLRSVANPHRRGDRRARPSGGSFSAAHALLQGRDQLLRLVRSPAGPRRSPSGSPGSAKPLLLRYGCCAPRNPRANGSPWGDGTAPRRDAVRTQRPRRIRCSRHGLAIPRKARVPPAPLVHICNPAGHCSRPHELHFGHTPAGADENQAIALSNDGTVSVIASFSKVPEHPAANTPLGLFAAVRRPGKPWTRRRRSSTEANSAGG